MAASTDASHPNPTLAEKLAHLYTLRGGPTIDLTIRPAYRTLLQRLGNPHLDLPPVVHVAGTNGKGSAIAFMRAVLEAAGYRVHVYSSPHLRKFNERIVLAGQDISDTALEALLDEVITANGDLPLTFFEITTALAFLAFARTRGDIVLLETGLGGRLDSTNVIEKPVATLIMPIARDHMEFLGDTIEQIANEKAGIMKRTVPCILARQTEPGVESALTRCATELSVPVQAFNHGWHSGSSGSGMTFRYDDDSYDLPLPCLNGVHQIQNAGAALAVIMTLRDHFNIPEHAIVTGLQTVHWPGRLQKIDAVHLMPDLSSDEAMNRDTDKDTGWELWADGAHNEGAAQALATQAALWQKQDNKPLHLIMGMMQRKDVPAFLAPLRPYLSSVTGVPIENDPQAHDRTGFMEALTATDLNILWADSVPAAINKITANPPGRILVTGSLYLMKTVLPES